MIAVEVSVKNASAGCRGRGAEVGVSGWESRTRMECSIANAKAQLDGLVACTCNVGNTVFVEICQCLVTDDLSDFVSRGSIQGPVLARVGDVDAVWTGADDIGQAIIVEVGNYGCELADYAEIHGQVAGRVMSRGLEVESTLAEDDGESIPCLAEHVWHPIIVEVDYGEWNPEGSESVELIGLVSICDQLDRSGIEGSITVAVQDLELGASDNVPVDLFNESANCIRLPIAVHVMEGIKGESWEIPLRLSEGAIALTEPHIST